MRFPGGVSISCWWPSWFSWVRSAGGWCRSRFCAVPIWARRRARSVWRPGGARAARHDLRSQRDGSCQYYPGRPVGGRSDTGEAGGGCVAGAGAGEAAGDEPERDTRQAAGRAGRRPNWVQIKTRLTPAQSQEVRDLNLACMADVALPLLATRAERIYPNGDFAHNYRLHQLATRRGVRASRRRLRRGDRRHDPGRVRAEYDVFGNLIAIGEHDLEPPVDGLDVTLTIDGAVQRLAEQQLQEAIRATARLVAR